MAAGGFRTFIPGEVLDEDKINDFLMQGILVFDDAAARDAAITAPVEGQFVFLKDSDSVEFFDGSDFVEFSGAPPLFEYVVVGGGASGGRGVNNPNVNSGGGGGAGGYRSSVSGELSGGSAVAEFALLLEPDSYTVTIGAGGPARTVANQIGVNGNPSRFGNVFAYGGGGGGSSFQLGLRGASGGGGGAIPSGTTAAGPLLDNQGSLGGTGTLNCGGGGGGALQAGFNGSSGIGGAGGDGIASSITGSSVTRAGGGGGNQFGAGGDGGGGNANNSGTANTGGGGGGGRFDSNSGAGGSGIVILKYPSSITLTIGAGLTSSTTTSGDFKITSFTAGTDTVSF